MAKTMLRPSPLLPLHPPATALSTRWRMRNPKMPVNVQLPLLLLLLLLLPQSLSFTEVDWLPASASGSPSPHLSLPLIRLLLWRVFYFFNEFL